MPEILDWRRVARPEEVVRFVGASLRRGAVVAFPTESAFVAAAAAHHADAVGRVAAIAGRRPVEVLVASPAAARDWLPALGGVGQRLLRRAWPGPVTLVAPREAGGLADRLPEPARGAVTDSLHLRHPADELLLEVLKRQPMPLVGAPLPDAYATRQAAATPVDLVIDGQGRYAQPPTRVEVRGAAWAVQAAGAVSADELREQLACHVVFVCTGNTCRSPLAEGLCKVRLAERLGCPVAELEDRGYRVSSAGLAAGPGFPAADEAVAVAAAFGADLTRHESRPLTLEQAGRADHLLVMTRGHLRALEAQLPRGAGPARLVSPDGADVDDPIGGSREVYEACARQLDAYIRGLVAAVVAG